MGHIEISKEEWEAFIKWKNDREHTEMGNESIAGERNNSNNQGSNNGESNSRVQNETEKVTLQLQPNKPKPEPETEEVECAGCGFKGKYPINQYPDKCPRCGIEWR